MNSVRPTWEVPMEDKDKYECCICFDWLLNPFITECGHRFCEICIHPWIEQKGSCPSCRTKLEQNQLFPDNFTKREIAHKTLSCPYQLRGCLLNLSVLDINEHCNNCKFRSQVSCDDNVEREHQIEDLQEKIQNNLKDFLPNELKRLSLERVEQDKTITSLTTDVEILKSLILTDLNVGVIVWCEDVPSLDMLELMSESGPRFSCSSITRIIWKNKTHTLLIKQEFSVYTLTIRASITKVASRENDFSINDYLALSIFHPRERQKQLETKLVYVDDARNLYNFCGNLSMRKLREECYIEGKNLRLFLKYHVKSYYKFHSQMDTQFKDKV